MVVVYCFTSASVCEIYSGGKNLHLCVNQGNPDPVVSKQSGAPGPEFVHLLKEDTNRKMSLWILVLQANVHDTDLNPTGSLLVIVYL